jgi:hypothetical protein
VYADRSASYDEVAHHSGLERVDTFEALRKLDHSLRASTPRRLRTAPRVVVLSDHGQTQGADVQAAPRLRARRARRALARALVAWPLPGAATSQQAVFGHAVGEATGKDTKSAADDVSGARSGRLSDPATSD